MRYADEKTILTAAEAPSKPRSLGGVRNQPQTKSEPAGADDDGQDHATEQDPEL